METTTTTAGTSSPRRAEEDARESDSRVRPQGRASRLQDIARALEQRPFTPHTLFRGGHAQTLRGALRWPRRLRMLREYAGAERRLFDIEPGVRLLAHCRWQTRKTDHPTLVLVHGLEGSSRSVYMLGTGRKAFRAGFNVVRLNVRNCGGTESLSPTLYHSGMSGDLLRVFAELFEHDRLPEIFLAGFSLGGNLVLKLAGELGADAPGALAGVAAVSPSLDLSASADAIERPQNRFYQWSFIRSLRRTLRRKHKLFPHLYDLSRLREMRTIRQFDDFYTAPHGGFRDSADYYARSSALALAARIRVPTLIIHAHDDPFIPYAPLRNRAISDNPDILLLDPPRGGHVAFVGSARRGEDRFWAENRVVQFCTLLSRGGR
ncbi:MAG TPA: alpha/beta fold hydrolase [Pyrinomonadaceae bacterium]